MPIYDYECHLCGHTVEVIQKTTHPHPICTGTQKKPHGGKEMNLKFPVHAKTARLWTVSRDTKEGV